MGTHTSEWEAVLERLGRLERTNRQWRVLATAALLILILALGMGATAQRVPDEIRAKAFVVVAPDGKQRARLGVTAEGFPALALFDENGKVRAKLDVTIYGMPVFSLSGVDGKVHASLMVTPSGAPTLHLVGRDEGSSIQLDVMPEPTVGLLSRKGGIALLQALADHGPSLTLFDPQGHPRGTFSSDVDGSASITLADSNGNPRVMVRQERITLDDGKGKQGTLLTTRGVGLTDENGKLRAGLILMPSGEPRVELFDETENLRATLAYLFNTTPGLYLYGKRGNDQQGSAAALIVKDDMPRLNLIDMKGELRAVLGSVELEKEHTGSVEQRGVSSLVLFDKEGKVFWKVP